MCTFLPFMCIILFSLSDKTYKKRQVENLAMQKFEEEEHRLLRKRERESILLTWSE